MASKLITTQELTGVRVLGGKNGRKRIGKVRRFVFHPQEKRCIGFIVKRPDLLWMFRRKDQFVSINGYDIVEDVYKRQTRDCLCRRDTGKILEQAWKSSRFSY